MHGENAACPSYKDGSHGWGLWGAVADSLSEEPTRLWPTPRSNDSSESVETLTARSERNYGRNKNGINLTAAIIDAASPEPTRLWPTPTVQDAKNNGGPSQWKRNSDPLNVAVQRWPTPTGDDANNATRQSGAYQSLTRVVGKLNPTWVEWLMGFPLGWTDLDVSETP